MRPKLLLFDEPTEGNRPLIVQLIEDEINGIRRPPRTNRPRH